MIMVWLHRSRKNINMETKTFKIVTSISMILTITVTILSIVGIAVTGFYPGIVVLFLIALVPIASKFYARQITQKADGVQGNYFTTLTILNLLSILVVLWMAFVILVDRVFTKIL
jgi:hypothetical protein